MTTRLFDRKISLTFAQKEFTNFGSASGAEPGLRINFRVTRTSPLVSDTAEISIYNLNKDSRALQGDVALPPVILAAGYADNIEVLFRGKARLVASARTGPDWITKLECGDGENERATARVQLAVKKGTSVADLFEQLTDNIGIAAKGALRKLRESSPVFGEGSDETQSDSIFSGGSFDAIDKVIQSIGWEITVQNEEFIVAPKGQTTDDAPIALSPESGLIGSPEVGLLGRIKAVSLLQPQIRPMRRVRLLSQQLDGEYRVEKCEYVGDTHDKVWYTNFEATPL